MLVDFIGILKSKSINSFFKIAHVTKIWKQDEKHRYMIRIKRWARMVVELTSDLSPLDIDDGMRVGVDTSIAGRYRVSVF